MPYSVVNDSPDCSGWAVVKDATGEVMGCHATEAEANKQLTAINIAEFGDRAVDTSPPEYIKVAARRGIDYYEQGLAGDGVTAGTIREARAMARGDISSDKVVRAAAWGQRHAVDLEASQNTDPQDDGWPGAGAVAHYLWGIDPLDPQPARGWFARKSEQVKADEARGVGDPPAYITDVDNTLVTFSGDPIQNVIDYLNNEDGRLFVVTARAESRRTETVDELSSIGLRGYRLIMKPNATDDSVEFKRATARELLADWDIKEAIDDDPTMRRMYQSLGIEAKAPSEIDSPTDSPDEGDMERQAAMRATPTDNLVRAAATEGATTVSEDGKTLFGHFSMFNNFYEINSAYEGRFLERIAPGAFADTLARNGDRIKVLYDHGMDPQLGNKPLGTIRSMGEDKQGAFYEVGLIDTNYNRDFIIPAAQAGLLGSSFRFKVVDEVWADPRRSTASNPDRLPERTITKLEVFEFGPVTFPANPAATASVRSATDEWHDRLLHDPKFVARFTERVGLTNVERVLSTIEQRQAAVADATSATVDNQMSPDGNTTNDEPASGSRVRSKAQRAAFVATRLSGDFNAPHHRPSGAD